jgi:uncharacterized protein YjcR
MIAETRSGQRIPAEEYEVIVDAFGRGVPVKDLAEDYGVSPSRIYQILRAQGIHASDYQTTEEPDGLAAVIQRHQAPYEAPEARAWIEDALRAWAGERE